MAAQAGMPGSETGKPHAANWSAICGQASCCLQKGQKKKHIQVRPLPEANQIKIVGHEKPQLENEMVVREKNHAPRGCMSVGCYIAHF